MHDQCWICFASGSLVVMCEPLLPFLWTSVAGSWRTGSWKGASLAVVIPSWLHGLNHAELNDSRQARQLSRSEPRGPNSMPGGWKKCCESPLKYNPRLHGTGVAELETPRARGFLNQKGASSYRRKELGTVWINNQDRRSGVTIKSCAPKFKGRPLHNDHVERSPLTVTEEYCSSLE